MTRITVNDQGVQITGHAGYATDGNGDIVCAAVSVLFYTLVNAAVEKGALLRCHEAPGDAQVMWRLLSQHAKCAIDTCVMGFKLLAQQYPAYVGVTDERT